MNAHMEVLTNPRSEGKEGEEESKGRGAEEIGLAFPRAEIRFGIPTREMVAITKTLVTQKA